MKRRLFTVMLALALFTTAVWLLQIAVHRSAPHPDFRQTPQQNSRQDSDNDLGEIKFNQVQSHETFISFACLAALGQII